jgi:membrane fusion protein (multidrug efflux system)
METRLEPPPPRRSRRPFIILGVVLSCIALGCLGYWLLNRGYVTTDDAEIDGDVTTIAPQIPGRVSQIPVADNQHVTQGQVLAVLDDRDEQAALAKAQADQAQAQAQLGVAQAQLAETSATLRQAQQDDARYAAINPRAVTQQAIDAATATILGAKAKYNAAQASVVAAQAQVQAAQVAVRNANLQLSYTLITAPGPGHISMKTVEPGNVLAAGSPMMALVGDDVWVTANYKETQLADIHPGEQASIAVDAIPGITFKAHVDSIQYGTGAVFSLLPAQNATGNYVKIIQRVPVKIVFDDRRITQYLLAPGMSVEPSITISP